MLHHLSIAVSDLGRASAFYDAVLKPLGYTRVFADDEAVGYGYEGGDDKLCLKLASHVVIPGEGFHLAFSATEPDQVHEFHAAVLRHGGRCNGAPGPRPEYGEGYYAAFVVDPDGYRIEAVVNATARPFDRQAAAMDARTSHEDAGIAPEPLMLAERAALDYFDSQTIAIARTVSAFEAWTIMTSQTGMAMRMAFKVRDEISAWFGVKRIGGFSGARRDRVVTGEHLDFFLVEHAAPRMLVLTARDRHLDVMICLTTGANSATVTASVMTKNAFGRIYMMPVGPAHRRIVSGHLRRLRATLAAAR